MHWLTFATYLLLPCLAGGASPRSRLARVLRQPEARAGGSPGAPLSTLVCQSYACCAGHRGSGHSLGCSLLLTRIHDSRAWETITHLLLRSQVTHIHPIAPLPPTIAPPQMDLLQRTGWRMRLDLAADVLPCYIQLFCPALLGDPKLQLGQQAQLTMPAASTAAHQEWAAALRQLCAVIREKVNAGLGWERSLLALHARQLFSRAARLPGLNKGFAREAARLTSQPMASALQSRRLKAHEQASNTSRLPTPEPEDEAEPPAKRRRAAGNT